MGWARAGVRAASNPRPRRVTCYYLLLTTYYLLLTTYRRVTRRVACYTRYVILLTAYYLLLATYFLLLTAASRAESPVRWSRAALAGLRSLRMACLR